MPGGTQRREAASGAGGGDGGASSAGVGALLAGPGEGHLENGQRLLERPHLGGSELALGHLEQGAQGLDRLARLLQVAGVVAGRAHAQPDAGHVDERGHALKEDVAHGGAGETIGEHRRHLLLGGLALLLRLLRAVLWAGLAHAGTVDII